MIRILSVGLISLFAILLPTMAQPAPMARPPLEIQQVQFQRTDDGTVQALIQGVPTHRSRQPHPTEGCAAPPGADVAHTLHTDETILTLLVYSTVPVGDAACPGVAPFTTTIDLGSDFDAETTYTVHINDRAVEFTPSQLTSEPQQATVNFAAESIINEVTVANTDDNTLTLAIAGENPDGCDVPLMTASYPDAVNDRVTHINVFRSLSPLVDCPAVLTMFTQEVTTNLAADTAHIIELNDRYFQYQPDDQQIVPVTRQLTRINDVETTMTDDGLEIAINGTNDGECGDIETQNLLMMEHDVVYVELVRFVPLDTACTRNLAPYETTLTTPDADANTPIVVNGSRFNLPINVSSDSNVQRVPAVIETVDVTILESDPPQLQLTISGYHPDGCQAETQIEQDVRDDTIAIRIFRELPGDAICPMTIVPIEETLTFQGTFSSGTVTIQVNGMQQTIDL